MTHRASLGVLLPTRNSAAVLPDHLAALRAWIDLADEVVVVDSFSTDGTLDLIRQHLPHPNLRFLSHPPGLYASWNAGIRALTAEYAYISTAGDTITQAGIEQLSQTMRTFGADVVLSKPVFKKPDGEVIPVDWPIDDILRSLRVAAPRSLHPLEMIAFACAHATQALTGSCASNLFRTRALQQFPFPTEFGTAGDGVWSLRQAAGLAWAVVPESFSTFLLHPTGASQSENRAQAGAPRADAILRGAVQGWLAANLINPADLSLIGWTELIACLTQYLDAKTGFDRFRKASWPWILRPSAWLTRVRRDQHFTELHTRKSQALQAALARRDSSGSSGVQGLPRAAQSAFVPQ